MRNLMAFLLAGSVVLAGCGAEAVIETEPATSSTVAPNAGLVACSDVPMPGPIELGNLGGMANPEEAVMSALMAYAEDNNDVFGGLWIDRDHGGTVVLAFTDDPDMHLAAIRELFDADGDVPVIDAVRVEFTEDQLREIQSSLPLPSELPIAGTGIDAIRNRVAVGLLDPTEADLAGLAALVPPDGVCVSVSTSPKPPAGPLDVIPEPGSDPLVSCLGSPPFPVSSLRDPIPVEGSDHPAALAFVEQLADQTGMEPMPWDGWIVAAVGEETASFLRIAADISWMATMELKTVGWQLAGTSANESCEPVVELPEGTGRVTWRLDPAFPAPGPDDTTLHLELTEQACANGEPMGDRLLGPQVVETDEQVLIAFVAVSVIGDVTCPGNPPTAVTVELDAPVGARDIGDGVVVTLE